MTRTHKLFAALTAALLVSAASVSAAPAPYTLYSSSPAAGQPVRWTVNRANTSAAETLILTTKDNTALAGTDYQASNVSVSYAPQQVSATILVPTTPTTTKYGQTLKFGLVVSANGTAVASALASITEPAAPPPPPPPTPTWTKCASENGTCYVVGTANVRYGAGTKWLTKSVTGSIACNNATWTDPIVGTLKECDTDGTVGTAPPPPPPPKLSPIPANAITSWVNAPLTVGGYACNNVSDPKTPPCGAGIVYKITGTVPNGPSVLYTAVFAQDASGEFPANDSYAMTFVGVWSPDSLQGIAPAQ